MVMGIWKFGDYLELGIWLLEFSGYKDAIDREDNQT
jgi:hypothetical protein